MPRPLLMVLDGGTLRTPAFESAFASAGWEVAWVESRSLDGHALDSRPDTVLVAVPANPAASARMRTLRGRDPRLPYLVVGPGLLAPDLGSPAGRLDPFAGPERWVQSLKPHRGPVPMEDTKFTSEDLFGDIVADLEAGDEPDFLRATPTPAPPQTSPAPLPVGVPEAQGLPDLFESLLGPPDQVAPKAAPLSDDFTLSGFSGIRDPFAMPEAERPGMPAHAPGSPHPAPTLVPPSGEPGNPEEFGNYYLLEKIAVGGMAELFKARQRGVHDFQKIVAIKRILPHLSDNDEFVRMFIDEAKLAAQLTHPNIVQIFDLGRAGGFYYIAMEYVDGKDLRSILRKVREFHLPLPERVAAYVVMRVANALDYAHRKRGMDDKELRLVHRDVSPQNILISSEGAVKLVDFGIAKAATKSTQTMAGALKGKLLYMSPEQALGQSLDSRSDIYSLGLVLFELLTGERCFQADSELGVLEKVRLGKVTDIRAINPDISAGMVAILDKALQKNLDFRYTSARALEIELKDLCLSQGGEPTEHEVAEFMSLLLRGAQEPLQRLIASRFAPVAKPEVFSQGPVAPAPRLPAPVPSPAPAPTLPGDRQGGPRWMIVLLVVVILAIVGFLLWVLL
nr:protein kinase [uncultured Holophaga sp.]